SLIMKQYLLRVAVYDSNDEDETLAELHHLFAMPESPFPFLPDDEEQSSSSVQHHAHAPSTQATVQSVDVENEKEVEDDEEGEYVVRDVMDKGKRVASSPLSRAPFTQVPITQSASILSSSSSSRISLSQSGVHRGSAIPSPSSPTLSRLSQAASQPPVHSCSLSPLLSSQVVGSQPSTRPPDHALASSSLSQLSSCAPTRSASSPKVNRKRRRASHFPTTHVTSQSAQAESSRTAQLRDRPDSQTRGRQDRIVEDRLLDALGHPAPSGRTHPVYATNNPPRAVPPLLNPSQASASSQSLSSSLVHYTESKLSMHNDRMNMQAKKMDILQGAVKCFEIMLTRERPARRPRYYYRDEWDRDVDEQEPETEDEDEYEKD
ncbi:hypothetical protein BGZ92_005989, partial [Podila epicladia]